MRDLKATAEKTARLSVRLCPNASRDEIVGFDGQQRLRIKVAAPPVGGAANKQLIKLLSKRLRLSKLNISIASGQKRRDKVVEIKGLCSDEIEGQLMEYKEG